MCTCGHKFENSSTFRQHIKHHKQEPENKQTDIDIPLGLPLPAIKKLQREKGMFHELTPNSDYWKKRLIADLRQLSGQERKDWMYVIAVLKFTAKTFCLKLEKIMKIEPFVDLRKSQKCLAPKEPGLSEKSNPICAGEHSSSLDPSSSAPSVQVNTSRWDLVSPALPNSPSGDPPSDHCHHSSPFSLHPPTPQNSSPILAYSLHPNPNPLLSSLRPPSPQSQMITSPQSPSPLSPVSPLPLDPPTSSLPPSNRELNSPSCPSFGSQVSPSSSFSPSSDFPPSSGELNPELSAALESEIEALCTKSLALEPSEQPLNQDQKFESPSFGSSPKRALENKRVVNKGSEREDSIHTSSTGSPNEENFSKILDQTINQTEGKQVNEPSFTAAPDHTQSSSEKVIVL